MGLDIDTNGIVWKKVLILLVPKRRMEHISVSMIMISLSHSKLSPENLGLKKNTISIQGLKSYDNDWEKIAALIDSRSEDQVRVHHWVSLKSLKLKNPLFIGVPECT